MPKTSIWVFISYSRADHELYKKLEEHLSPLMRSRTITIWHGQDIPGGVSWDDLTDTHLAKADIILILVSASYVASSYCWSQEVRTAIERHKAGTAVVRQD